MTIRMKDGRVVCPLDVQELTPLRYTAQLTKVTADGEAPMELEDLSALTVTIFSLDDPAHPIVAGVDHADILNTGRGTVDADGFLTLLLEDADNPILDDTLAVERHCVRIAGTYNADSTPRTTRRDIEVRVRNLVLEPAPP